MAFTTAQQPEKTYTVSGDIDYELIYVDMSNQEVPRGNYPETLSPGDYYSNDYFLLGGFGRFGALFKPKLKVARTSPPTIGLGAIARFDDRLVKLMVNFEKFIRYTRLGTSFFKGSERTKYLWSMYRSQGEKTVMLEGDEYSSALGFKIGGKLFNTFAGVDPVLLELGRGRSIGLHNEHTLYPKIVPLQIVIVGNVAILGVSGEPGNIAGQRIEKTVYEQLKHRGVKTVIVNGYANENTGYIFTPEEYPHQFTPSQCGFVLYGRWTSPAFRYNFEKLANAMLYSPEERDYMLDRDKQPYAFSPHWYRIASFLEFLEPKQ